MTCKYAFKRTMLIHFGPHQQKKRLKCDNCMDYKYGSCDGKGYKYKDVIKCMQSHVEQSENEYLQYLNMFY